MATDYPTANGYMIQIPSLSPVSGNVGIYAIQSIDLTFNVPVGNFLYAPTLKGRGDCLEITTAYAGTDSGVWVWDFCQGATNVGARQTYIKMPQMGNYIRNLGRNRPEYVAESYRDSTGIWRAILYNFATQRYDELYNTTGDPRQVETGSIIGWDAWEVHTPSSTFCPAIPFASSRSFQTLTDQLTWSIPQGIAPLTNFSSCFVPGAAQKFTFPSANEWQATFQ